jgi:hypothetical protein
MRPAGRTLAMSDIGFTLFNAIMCCVNLMLNSNYIFVLCERKQCNNLHHPVTHFLLQSIWCSSNENLISEESTPVF